MRTCYCTITPFDEEHRRPPHSDMGDSCEYLPTTRNCKMNTRLKDAEEELLHDESSEAFGRGVLSARRRLSQRLWLGANICVFAFSFSFFVASLRPKHVSDNECGVQLAGWSRFCWEITPSIPSALTIIAAPALPAIEYETIRFRGFYTTSPYKGYPNDSIEDAWQSLIHSGFLRSGSLCR
jgi:hypothetical protein